MWVWVRVRVGSVHLAEGLVSRQTEVVVLDIDDQLCRLGTHPLEEERRAP